MSPVEQLHQHILTNGGKADPATRFRASVDSVELRISDCFEPPKVEAFIKVFCSTENLESSQTVPLGVPLSTAPSAAELLRRYVAKKTSEAVVNEMSSPDSIKSQLALMNPHDGHDADVLAGSVDSSPISQMRLATQAPMLAKSPVVRRPLSEIERNVSRQPSSKSPFEDTQYPRHEVNQPASSEEHDPIGLVQNKIEHKEKIADQTKSTHIRSLPVNSCKSPHNRQISAKDVLCPNHESGHHSKSVLKIAQEPQLDINMHLNFRRWRAEAAIGRYIPRRACKISKQQLKILESDERWQPPLPGRDRRPGTVPIDLLNELTARADEAVEHAESAPDPDSVIQGQTGALLKEPPAPVDDTSSADELGESQWSLSPGREQPARLLPPDSSLPSPDSRKNDSGPYEVSVNGVQSEEEDASDDPTATSHVSEPPQDGEIDASLHTQTEARLTRKSPSTWKQQLNEERNAKPDMHQHISSFAQSDHALLRKILVSETPYPGKVIRVGPIAQVSQTARDLRPYPDPSFVPSTYLEGTPAKLHESRKRPNPHQPAQEIDEVHQHTLKRKAVDAEPTMSAKRSKVERKDRGAQPCDPAFASVFQDIREYRRQALQPLTKDFKEQNPARPSISVDSDRTTAQSVASEQSHVSKAVNGVIRPPHVSTPITVPSSRPTSKDGLQRVVGTTSATSSLTGIEVPQQLFDKFVATYIDYQGSKLHFDSAISLLRQLRLSRNDPHPSLYDDFIWHQYHSYLPYALGSIGNPLSYHAYYNQHIESPSHFAKVITAASLDQLCNSKPDLKPECLDDSHSASDLLRAERLNDASESRSLINSVPLVPAHAVDRLDVAAVVHQNTPEQPVDATNPSQKSSVETWLEGTARAASPDLGTPEDVQSEKPPDVVAMPPPRLNSMQGVSPAAPRSHSSAPNSAMRNKKKRQSASPFAQTLRTAGKRAAEEKDEELTPFKRWAKAILSLPGETLATGVPERPTQPVNIFAWR